MDQTIANHPYLQGNYAPVPETGEIALKVTGDLPRDLAGSLYRNGPNPQFPPHDPNHHWFLGDGMLHAFHIADGRVRYLNRWVRTPRWRLEHAAGRPLYGAWGNPATTDPSALGTDSGVANTAVVWHAGRLLALEEGHRPFAVDPATLDPVGYQDYAPRFTAHPKIDPETGEMVFFAYSNGGPLSAQMAYGVVDAAGRVTRYDRFETPYCSMVHDFMVTRDHVLFPVLPLTGSMQRAMSGKPAFAWDPAQGARVGLMRRDAPVSAIRWFTVAPCYVFHVMNAWDEGDTVVADVMRYDAAPLFPLPDGRRGEASAARLVRWTFDLADGGDIVTETPLDDMAGEFPRIDERFAGLGYRHGFFACESRGRADTAFDGLSHIDHVTGRVVRHVLPPGDAISEPVFVPRSAGAAEGDGWLLAVTWRAAENRSDLLIYDTGDIAKGPVATAHLPVRVPFGFHGAWRPAT